MLSGRDTLHSIDGTLTEVRRQGQELDEMVQQASNELLKLRHTEVEHYRRLAALHLEQINNGEVLHGLNDTNRQINMLLDQRDQRLRSIKDAIDDTERQQQALAARRATHEGNLQQANELLDHAEAETQQRLGANPEHQSALALAKAADDTAREAESKAAQAEQDRTEKGKPYESESLFMYLWRRGFGTSSYSAFPLIRYLDSRVATLCRFQAARPNYAMLLEIPLRLREHAQQVRGVADEALRQLRELEADAAREDGLTAHQEAVEQAQQALHEVDEEIQELERQFESLMQERALYAGGEDEFSTNALNILAAQFQQQTLKDLRRRAEATASPEDDTIVHELRDLEYEKQQAEESLAHHKSMHARHLKRQRELEAVRRDFKDKGYDDPQSTFSNGELVGGILREFLRGVAGSADVWGTLRRNQRRRPGRSKPDFGSGGFGRGGSTWRLPPGGGSGGGNGGFRTGGGF